MKMITDYFSINTGKSVSQDVETLESDDEEVYYEARKIKIRLADPSKPDSFVCEIYDTSLEEPASENIPVVAAKENKSTRSCSDKRKLRKKRCRSRATPVDVEQVENSSDEDETLISVRKRLRACVENRQEKAVSNPKTDNILRTPNGDRTIKRKQKIGDYFTVNETDRKPLEKTSVKPNLPLAPVFRKAVKKPKEDSEVLKARRSFLLSGLPEKMRKTVVPLKCPEDVRFEFFPAISHVRQSTDGVFQKRLIDLHLKPLEIYEERPLVWKTFLNIGQPSPRDIITKKLPKLDVKKVKSAYKNIDIDSHYKALKEKLDGEERFVAWSEKYQPSTSSVLFNDSAVKKLKTWLTAWKRFGDFDRESRDSSDDFVSSGDEEPNRRPPQTACLLQGPVGCGKTAVVRALAAEMDFHVLEINSSSKRSGKKMLADLQEATKSHKILQEDDGSLFKVDAKSVIVVEEADVIFDQDDGFVSGLQTLISSAKRPVVLLTNDSSVEHLQKFCTGQTLQLTMNRPRLSWSCAVLELIALLEGASPPRSYLSGLLNQNNGDLRKSILELQFWAEKSSGGWKNDPFSANNKKDSLVFSDSLSVGDVIGRNKFDTEIRPITGRIRDSCSLDQNWEIVDRSADVLKEIHDEIVRRSSLLTNNPNGAPTTNQNRAEDELKKLLPKTTNRRDASLDYFPILRQICRTEKVKQGSNLKRGNRFFHYLQTLGLKPSSGNLEIHCSTLCNK